MLCTRPLDSKFFSGFFCVSLSIPGVQSFHVPCTLMELHRYTGVSFPPTACGSEIQLEVLSSFHLSLFCRFKLIVLITQIMFH